VERDDRFEELLAQGAAVPVDGWDFSWFAGRATEERPPWGYARLLSERMGQARAALDLDTGGGEVLAGIAQPPPVLRATEAWPPNVALARQALAPLGGEVVEVAPGAALPFPDASFDLVTSRHPVDTDWAQIARVLAPGGVYLSQQVGMGSMHEVTDAMMGPQPVNDYRSAQRHAALARAAGLDVLQLREARLRTEFHDIAALVVYLRKVIWIVPGFTVEQYRPQLLAVHRHIGAHGAFVGYATRFLIEARKPAGD
jgi:SAM-dependent methyltransferase